MKHILVSVPITYRLIIIAPPEADCFSFVPLSAGQMKMMFISAASAPLAKRAVSIFEIFTVQYRFALREDAAVDV